MIDLKNSDIGNIGIKGSIKKDGDITTVLASGSDVWGKEDAANFSYCEINGDFDITVRIQSLSMAHLFSKCGIMARESLNSGSKNVFLVAFGDNSERRNNDGGCEYQYRSQTNGESKGIYPEKLGEKEPMYLADYPNVWLKLERKGDEFCAYFSNDNEIWKTYCVHTLKMQSKLYAGICATSHDNTKTSECKFSNFKLIQK